MTRTSETITFFGSGPVAAASLERLAQHFAIEAVITKPRPPHHKGDVPVLRVAEDLNLPVLTVSNRQELDDLIDREPVRSETAVLIDFGIIVSQKVIDYFPRGIINSHFSVLPEWRGADPITFSILSGQPDTGVSLMLLVAAMDEGPLLAYDTLPLDSSITTPRLTEQLIDLSDKLLSQTLPTYMAADMHEAQAQLQSQDVTGRQTSYSRKLSKDDSRLDFTKPAAQLEREIRAFIEWPRSHTAIADKEIVITAAHVESTSGTPGALWLGNKQFGFYTTDGVLAIDRLKPAGKQEMTAEAFLAGYGKILNA